MLREKRVLWPWAIAPFIINIIILLAAISIFAAYYGGIHSWLTSLIGIDRTNTSAEWYAFLWSATLWVADKIVQLLVILLSAIIMLVFVYAASFIIAAPFNDLLSERVELMLTGKDPPSFELKRFICDLLRTIKVESIKAALLIAIPISLLILNLIPLIGSTLYIALTFAFGSWEMGYAFAELPFGRKASSLDERMQFAKENKWKLIGFGAGYAIPLFNLIFAAPMVVGGTILYVESVNTLKDTRIG